MERLKKLTPPGTDGMKTIQIIAALWVLVAIERMARFAFFFPMALGSLPNTGGSTYAEMPIYQSGFGALLDAVFTAVHPLPPVARPILLFYLAVKGIVNERSYRQGSRADYTMNRLPDRWERHRRAWALPGIGLLGLAVIALIITLVCQRVYGFYVSL